MNPQKNRYAERKANAIQVPSGLVVVAVGDMASRDGRTHSLEDHLIKNEPKSHSEMTLIRLSLRHFPLLFGNVSSFFIAVNLRAAALEGGCSRQR